MAALAPLLCRKRRTSLLRPCTVLDLGIETVTLTVATWVQGSVG